MIFSKKRKQDENQLDLKTTRKNSTKGKGKVFWHYLVQQAELAGAHERPVSKSKESLKPNESDIRQKLRNRP